jgi:hypothetical protein
MHRYAQCASLIPVVVNADSVALAPVPSPSIFCTFVSFSTERIIFIIMSNTTNSEDEHGETPALSPYNPKLIESSRDERSNIYLELDLKAEVEAEKRAQLDINGYEDKGEKLPTREHLHNIARSSATEAITFTYLLKLGSGTAPLRQHYIQSYLRYYHKYLEEASMHGMFVSEKERKIQHEARRDAVRDKQNDIDLSDVELTCHSTIRAQEALTPDTRTTEYIEHIIKHGQVYKHAYREEVDRIQRPSLFPNEWQSARPPQAH